MECIDPDISLMIYHIQRLFVLKVYEVYSWPKERF